MHPCTESLVVSQVARDRRPDRPTIAALPRGPQSTSGYIISSPELGAGGDGRVVDFRWRPAAAPRRSTYWRMKLNVP